MYPINTKHKKPLEPWAVCSRVGSNLAGQVGSGQVNGDPTDLCEFENLLTQPVIFHNLPDPDRGSG